MSAPSVRAALAEIMALIDEGWLVRNTTNDGHFPSYLRESARLVKALATAQEALATPDPAEALAEAVRVAVRRYRGMIAFMTTPRLLAPTEDERFQLMTQWAADLADAERALAAYAAGREEG